MQQWYFDDIPFVATVECVHKRASRTKPDRGIARFVTTVRNREGQRVLEWEREE
jgi:hypothetical protein